MSAPSQPATRTANAPETPSGRAGISLPELLAPAGDWECAKAAVENGADAIYFGLERFNARMRAKNFTVADLPRLMEFLHGRGVRGYVTFNTLVFQNELEDAAQYLRSIICAGVDAAIVQDVGVCRLIRSISPDFPIHASTQMTITSAAGIEFARDLGCDLVVLARECSIAEIEKMRSASAAAQMPLEVFVHGALCVAYSGQCLTSEALGGRSANRGECAQACRMPYTLVSDGKEVPLGDRRYLLSPQDLSGLEALPDLIRAGVNSLKIEGRLKAPEYVASITRVYRQALDRAAKDLEAGGRLAEAAALDQGARYQLEMAFSRGLHTGWFRGINNQELVHARFGKKRGVFLGEVRSIGHDAIAIRLEAPLKAGDGVVFDAGRPDQTEEGGRVHGVTTRGEETLVRFGAGDIDFSRVRRGDRLWKTSDPELDRELRQTFAGDTPLYRRPLAVEAHGGPGLPLTLIARDEMGNVAQAVSQMPLAVAEKHPLTVERLRDQLGRLGGTALRLERIDSRIEGAVMLPVSELNRLRREIMQELETLRAKPSRWEMVPEKKTLEDSRASIAASVALEPELIVLVRTLPQLESALRSNAKTIYCEFEDPKKYREAVSFFREWPEKAADASIFVAPPRIFKTGEDWVLSQVRSCAADGYLVRNYDHLKYFAADRKRGDFSLNVANSWTAQYYLECFGLERVTASYDLNADQLADLLQGARTDALEIVIHQHIPMFHMEHCVFCAFLSEGTDYRNCGRPCDEHEVKLRDRVGAEHPLRADAGCRNTVFNSLAQTGAEHVTRFLAAGARHFRIEFLNESAEQTAKTIRYYQGLLRGEVAGSALWRELKLLNQLGVTRGPMEFA